MNRQQQRPKQINSENSETILRFRFTLCLQANQSCCWESWHQNALSLNAYLWMPFIWARRACTLLGIELNLVLLPQNALARQSLVHRNHIKSPDSDIGEGSVYFRSRVPLPCLFLLMILNLFWDILCHCCSNGCKCSWTPHSERVGPHFHLAWPTRLALQAQQGATRFHCDLS